MENKANEDGRMKLPDDEILNYKSNNNPKRTMMDLILRDSKARLHKKGYKGERFMRGISEGSFNKTTLSRFVSRWGADYY